MDLISLSTTIRIICANDVMPLSFLFRVLLNTPELLSGSLHGLVGVVWEVNLGQTTLLEPLKGLEHTLETEYLLGRLLNVHTQFLNVLFNVDGRHCTYLKFVPFK